MILFRLHLLLFLAGNVDAFKYLMYNPVYAPSHVMFADKIAKTLRQAGHTVIQLNPVQTTNFDLKKLDHKDNWIRWPNAVKVDEQIGSRLANEMWESDGLSLEELFKQFHQVGLHHADHCTDLIQDKELMQKLRDENFDMAMTEYYDICGLGVFEKVGIKKYVAFTPFPVMHYIAEAFGLPLATSFVPDLSTVATSEMTFNQRIQNFISPLLVGSVSRWSLFGYSEKVLREHVNPNFNVLERCAEASYLFINSDAVLDFSRPTSDKFIHIGGLGISDTSSKPLESKFQKIMDSAKDGVILVSFGTIALSHQIPQWIKQVFLESFREFPNYTFLWKYEKPEHKIAENFSNVIDVPWIPQRDIFTHPKLRGFITHGGLNSINEAAYGGVPVVAIGLFGDQQRNAKMAEYRGFGINMDKQKISKETLVEKLRELIENDKYRQKAKEMAEMLRSKPHTAEELLVKYTEYATKFDVHSYLDLYGRRLNFIQYHSLDVIAVLIIVCTSLILVVVLAVRLLVLAYKRLFKKENFEFLTFTYNLVFRKDKLD